MTMSHTRHLTAATHLAALALVQLFTLTAIAAEPAKVTVETVAHGLHDPRAIAVRPDTGSGAMELFIAETGAGRVTKVVPGKSEKPADVISGFSTKAAHSTGVQSVFFLDRSRLVASGGDDDGKPFVRLYEVPESNTPLAADQAKDDADLAENDQGPKLEAHGFSHIARSRQNEKVGDFLIVAALGDSQPTGIAYIPVRAGTLADIFPIRLTGTSTDIAPTAITVAPSGYLVVASNRGGESEDSATFAFINPITRRIVMQIPASLTSVAALAYSPKTGNLYAAGVSKAEGRKSGVFRIDSGDPSSHTSIPVKIANIEQPTALSFAMDGSLYVTTSGNDKDDGTLVRVTGEL
jgi:hypothetical protein